MVQARPHQRGASSLEFVVVLLPLLMIMLMIVELSRAWLTLNLVTTAAREGARVASVTDPFDPNPAINRMNQILAVTNLMVDAGYPTVICTPPPGEVSCMMDGQVQADVSVTFQTFVPLLELMGLGPWNIQQSAIMRYE